METEKPENPSPDLARGRTLTDAGGAELDVLVPSNEALAARDLEQDIQLKSTYARWLLWLMTAQLAVTDLVFVVYAHFGAHWDLSAPVIDAWIGTTLVEVIGIVLVVTRYLFPRRDAA